MRSSAFDIAAVSAVSLAIALSGCTSEEPELPGEPIVTAVAKNRLPPPQPTPPAALTAETPPPGVKVIAQSEDDSGESPLTVHLEAKVREGSGKPPYTYLWDFGDGTPFASTSEVTHVYKFPGSFRASIIVTDKAGNIDQDYADVEVEPPGGEEATEPPMSAAEALEILKRAQERTANKDGKSP